MNKELKGINITDKGITYVKIPHSGTYLIDGNIVKIDSYRLERIRCKNPDDIRIVTVNKYIVEYKSGDNVLTPEEYEAQKFELRKKCVEEDGDGYEKWATLEDEFTYRKFLELWRPIYREEQLISDPIKVIIDHVQYDTGNPYIKSAFLNGDDNDDTLYSYSQNQAWKDFCKECFDELGMVFDGNVSYNKTANERIWGNSDHSCIRYVVAFGTYVFGDGWGSPKVIKGTLQDVKARCEQDKQSIRNIITRQYNKHFGDIDVGKFDFDALLKKLNSASTYMRNLKVYQKSSNDYCQALNQITNAINQINVAYGEK